MNRHETVVPDRKFTVTGQPIDVAHAALINLICEADGVLITASGEIQMQKGGAKIATIVGSDTDGWATFCRELLGAKTLPSIHDGTAVGLIDETRDPQPHAGYDRVTELQRAAAAEVREVLARPDAQHRELRSCDDFDPWDILPSLYGSYDSRFDDCVIDVLCELRDRTRRRDDLAADMIREMLCSADLCDYGTSPRHCFATVEFRELLPELIERWRAYAKQQWEDD